MSSIVFGVQLPLNIVFGVNGKGETSIRVIHTASIARTQTSNVSQGQKENVVNAHKLEIPESKAAGIGLEFQAHF